MQILSKKKNKDEIILQRLHRVAIVFAVSERIMSPGGRGGEIKKEKITNKTTYVRLTQSLADSVFCHC